MDINMDFGQLMVQSIGFIDRDEKNNKNRVSNVLMLDFMFNKELIIYYAEYI